MKSIDKSIIKYNICISFILSHTFYLMNFLKSIEYNECPHPDSNENRTRESTQCIVSYIKFKA